MKAIKANRVKILVIWFSYFIFNVLDFGDKGMVNIFQRYSGRLFYYVFIYFLFSESMPLDFTLPRLGNYKNYLLFSVRHTLTELLPQIWLLGIGCVLLSYPLNTPIEWKGALHFLFWLGIMAIFLGLFEQIVALSSKAKYWTLGMWIWLILCSITPESLINLPAWPMISLSGARPYFLSTGEFLIFQPSSYLMCATITLLLHAVFLFVVYILVLREKGVPFFR